MNDHVSEASARLSKVENYLGIDPTNLNLLDEAFELTLRTGDFPKASAYVDRALDVSRNDPRFRFKKGTLSLAQGDYPVASEIFSSLFEQGIQAPAVSYNLAYALLSDRQPEQALQALEKIPDEGSSQVPQYLVLKARVLYHLDRHQDAIDAVDTHLAHHGADINALSLKAMVLLDSGQDVEAAKFAQEALTLSAEDPEAHLVLGSVALEQQMAVPARLHFERAVQAAPKLGRAWSGLGFTALIEQNVQEAPGHFEKAVAYMKDHPGTWHGLAWTKILQGDLVTARKAVDAAMELDRNFADNHGSLAVISIFEGHPEEAEASIKRGLRLNPASPSCLFARSLMLSWTGDIEASKQLVTKILTGAGLGENAKLVEGATRFVTGFWSAPKKH